MCRTTMKNALFCSSVLYTIFIPILIASKDILEFSQPSACKSNEYFDTATFSCVQCDTRKNLKPSADRSQCICNEFSKTVALSNDYSICIFCGRNMTVTVDGKDCISCHDAKCQCDINEIQMDRNLNSTLLDSMQCISCPENTYLSMDSSKCLPCGNFKYSYYINNIYSTQYSTQLQDSCLYRINSFDNATASVTSLIEFTGQTIDSYYFRNELHIAIYFCKKKERVACEHLSNMCTLTLYTHKTACMLFMQKQLTPVWLLYSKNETKTVLNSNEITQNYSSKYSNGSALNFVAATFSLNGHFKSIDTPTLPCNLLKHVRFGINIRKVCKLQVKDLMNANVEFISPYLTFMKDNKMMMHSVPIFIKNIHQNFDNILDGQLVRKFFIVDNISGTKALSNFTHKNTRKSNDLSVLRYMKSLTIIINIQNARQNNKIFPPLLIIEYTELTQEQIDLNAEVTLNYKIKFILNNNNINLNFEIIIGVFTVLSLIFSGIKTWDYRKKHCTSTLNVTVLLWFVVYAVGNVGSTTIISLISFCIYLFLFYEGQSVPYTLFFNSINEKTIKVFTTIAFLFKLIEILGFICQYFNINIFFIDWEQPKAVYNHFHYKSPYIHLSKLYGNKFSDEKYQYLKTPSEIISAKRKKIHKSNDSHYTFKSKTNSSTTYSASDVMQSVNEENSINKACVSIWRTYFIVTQWLKLQTKRKISLMLQLIGVLYIYQITQLYPWILVKPELTSRFYDDNYNFMLYYAVCIVVYVFMYCIQWLLTVIFYKKCTTNEIEKFINHCSITNISIFILPFNYSGFYIHGRSVHGFADTDLPTLMHNLQKEENNLCAHKGLLPGTIQQTFILSLTKSFRNNVNKLLVKTKTEQTLDVQFELKQFFCQFVDHCLIDEDYIIKEQSVFEKLCNTLLYQKEDKSVFYNDKNCSFDQVLIYGNEWLLSTFEISVFAFIIAIYEDCILAITMTSLISISLMLIFKYNCKRNLSSNAQLDKIFI